MIPRRPARTGDLEDVRSIMIENIEKVMERGERIELLVDRTDRLAEESSLFRRQAVRARQRMEFERLKWYIGIGGGVGAVIYIILGSACGFALNKC